MLVIIVWLAYVYFVIQVLFNGLRIVSFPVSVGICVIGFFVMAFWGVHHLTRVKPRRKASAPAASPAPAAPAAAPAPSAAPVSNKQTFTFRVAGTTFSNPDGSSRQTILRHMKFGDEPYAHGQDPLEVGISPVTFEGAPAFEVHINGYMIGYVPKKYIEKMETISEAEDCTIKHVAIIGGGSTEDGDPISYGCEITLTYTPD